MAKIIDLRSDTATAPTIAMRQAIFESKVGDDMWGEDPTVNKLQQMSADLLGKEASIFTPSGTMANELAVKTLTQPGDAVVMLPKAHIYAYESGAAPIISGITIIPTGNKYGIITEEELLSLLPPDDQHFAPVTLLCLEIPHNGYLVPLSHLEKLQNVCKKHNIYMHLDGARIFNAAIALETQAKEIAKYFDTVCFCLSKGLGAPVGSMVCGSKKVISKVHRFRKILGGAMRQTGIVAAAGVYALENNIDRLAQDHSLAKKLATQLEKLPGISVPNQPVKTNMVFMDFSESGLEADTFITTMRDHNIIVAADAKKKTSRFITHLDITEEDIDYFLSCLQKLL